MRAACIHQILASPQLGGAEVVALDLAEHVRQHAPPRVQVWLPEEGPAAVAARQAKFSVRYFDAAAAYSRNWLRAFGANISTGARLRSLGRGLAHIHSPFVYGALRAGLKLAGVCRLVHLHLEYSLDDLRWALRHPPDVIVACARFLLDQVRAALPSRHAERVRLVALPNAIDVESFSPATDRQAAKVRVGAPLDRPLLLMLANLAPHKGQMTALRTVCRLREQGRDVQLWLAGIDRSEEQSYERELRQQIHMLGLDERVTLLGFRQDTPTLLQAADVVLLPSTAEGLPLSLLEAQASGVPVIAAPTAGIPEIIADGRTGFLVSAEDDAGYAARVRKLLDEPRLRQDIAAAALFQCRQRHSRGEYHRRITDLYADLLSV